MKKSTEILLKKAENDLKDAKILFKSDESSMEGICFHSQQAVEKSLKAYLAYNNREINKTHNISEILKDCKSVDNIFGELEKLNIDDITNYAVIVRYDDIIEPSAEDAKEAISIAEKVRSFVIEKINKLEQKQTLKPEAKEPVKDAFTLGFERRTNDKGGRKR